jgi:hypothetical protein
MIGDRGPSHTTTRAAAAAIVCALVWAPVSFWSITTILAVTHYAVALVYSRRQLAAACSSAPRALRLLSAVAVGVVVQQWNVPLLFYFGVHHVFSEVYVLQRPAYAGREPGTGPLRFWAILFNLCLYLAIAHQSPGNLPLNVLLAALAVTAGGYAASLWQARRRITARIAIESCAFEVLSLGLLALSFYTVIDVRHFIVYHVVFWGLYPVPRFIQTRRLGSFVGWHVLLLPALWWWSPSGPMPAPAWAWDRLFILSGYLHISISFALSSAQPAWLNRLFGVESSPKDERHRWLLLHVAGRAAALSLRLVPRPLRFHAAVVAARLVHALIARTAVYREEQLSNVDTVREAAVYHVLRVMTEHGTPFDLGWVLDGEDEIRAALDSNRGVLIVGPHSMLSTLVLRFAHDRGRAATAIADRTGFRLAGTAIQAQAVSPSPSFLIGIRGALQRGGVVCAMIDAPASSANVRRRREIPTDAGPRRVADGLIHIAARCGADVVFLATRVDGYRVVATFRTISTASAGDPDAITQEFIEFVQAHVAAHIVAPPVEQPRAIRPAPAALPQSDLPLR